MFVINNSLWLEHELIQHELKNRSLLKRNVMSTTFLQQILSNGLLLVVMGGQKSNLSCRFKLEPITTYHLDLL